MIASVTERARVASPLDPAFTSETRRSLRAMTVPPCFDLLPGRSAFASWYGRPAGLSTAGRPGCGAVSARPQSGCGCAVCMRRSTGARLVDGLHQPRRPFQPLKRSGQPRPQAAAQQPKPRRQAVGQEARGGVSLRAVSPRGAKAEQAPAGLSCSERRSTLPYRHILPHSGLRRHDVYPEASPATIPPHKPQALEGHSSSGSNIGFKASSGGRISICASLLRTRLRNRACCFNPRGAFVRSRCHANEPISISRGS